MKYTATQLATETRRLWQKLSPLGWEEKDCAMIAPATLQINMLKKDQNALILAHSYQTPDIMYGVADFVGDSYSLSVKAASHPAKKIIFCSVYFMGETAKLINPDKQVIVPRVAGCSLADSIGADDVLELRRRHPGAGVVCYVNSYASVKAKSDACCTSSNVVSVVENMPADEIIFIPDELMGMNLRHMTSKKIITWHGRCVVHQGFDENTVRDIRNRYQGVKILAHPECAPGVVALVDYAGGTAGMLDYVRRSNADTFMLVTECGLTDRFKAEFPGKKIVGTCLLCPFMKSIHLEDVLKALTNPDPEQIVNIPDAVARGARAALEKMFELEQHT